MKTLFYLQNISYLCTDECVSPSLKSPISTQGLYGDADGSSSRVGCPSVHIDGCLAIPNEV